MGVAGRESFLSEDNAGLGFGLSSSIRLRLEWGDDGLVICVVGFSRVV